METPPGHPGLHSVLFHGLSLGLGTPRTEMAGRRGDAGCLKPGCGARTSSPVSLSPLPALDLTLGWEPRMPHSVLVRLPLPPRTAWTVLPCSALHQAPQHTSGEEPQPRNTTSSTWRKEGAQDQFLLQQPSSCSCPSLREGPGHQQFQAGPDFLIVAAIGSMGSAHCPQGRVKGRGWAGGSWSPGKGEARMQGCSWATRSFWKSF